MDKNILIQDLIERETSGNYEIHGSVDNADCLVAFSFGYRTENGKISPGLSNIDLANFIKSNYSKLPKILQFEIADAITQEGEIIRIEKHREAGAYLNSLEVAKQAKEIMDKNSWRYAIVIAHPFHMPRVDAICKKLGMKTIVHKGLENIQFDLKSEQEWTRNKEVWIVKEKKSIKWHAENNWI